MLALAVVRFDPLPVAASVGGIGLVLLVWARLHPPTFDHWIARRYAEVEATCDQA